jgi:predicted SAM-dependent methyltransferase
MKQLIKTVLRPLRNRLSTAQSRRRLKSAVKRTPLKIIVGASGVNQPGWTATDASYLDLLSKRDWDDFFSDRKIDAILAEHVWEHLSLEDGRNAARNCFRFIKPGGYLRIAVPDGNHPDPRYIEHVKIGGNGPGADDHKVLYDCKLLSKILTEAGFTVRLLEYFDENGKFVFNDWDPSGGLIHRSKRFDERNQAGALTYTSVIADAFVPG